LADVRAGQKIVFDDDGVGCIVAGLETQLADGVAGTEVNVSALDFERNGNSALFFETGFEPEGGLGDTEVVLHLEAELESLFGFKLDVLAGLQDFHLWRLVACGDDVVAG